MDPPLGPGHPRKVQPIILDSPNGRSESSYRDESSGEEQEDCLTTERPVRLKRLYHPKQKRAVVAYAKQHSVTAAINKFSIPRTTINRWMVIGYFDREVTQNGVNKGAGRPHTYSTELENKILIWVLENRDLHLPITIPLLQAKALELVKADHSNFKASSGWAYKFMKRHSLVLRAKPSMAQELPATLEELILAFNRQIKRLVEINQFQVVGNMDETPLYFDIVPGRVLDKKGKKTIVRTTGNEERLDCCSDGSVTW